MLGGPSTYHGHFRIWPPSPANRFCRFGQNGSGIQTAVCRNRCDHRYSAIRRDDTQHHGSNPLVVTNGDGQISETVAVDINHLGDDKPFRGTTG